MPGEASRAIITQSKVPIPRQLAEKETFESLKHWKTFSGIFTEGIAISLFSCDLTPNGTHPKNIMVSRIVQRLMG